MQRWQGLLGAAAGAGLLIGLASGALLRNETPSPTPAAPASREPAPTGSLRREVAALDAALDVERQARRALESEIERLRQQLAALEYTPPEGPEPEPETPTASEPARPSSVFEVFEEAKLRDRGTPEDTVRRLRELYDAELLDELYLHDTAVREEWLRSSRYRNELSDLRLGLREEIGEDDYDLILYAAGKKNRVVVENVLLDSPAMDASIERGDVLYSYDGRRVFRLRELKRLTTEGEAGATVAVVVERDGQRLRFFLPRGPLGVTLRATTRAPD